MNVPSMKRISPPTGVHASPVTTPGTCSQRTAQKIQKKRKSVGFIRRIYSNNAQ
jgi:hypothetical protein